MRATHLVHDVMGAPPAEGPRRLKTPGICCVCGEREGDVDARDVVGGNFTRLHLLRRRDSPAVCEACAWAKGHAPLRRSHWLACPSTGLLLFKWTEAAPILMHPPEPPFAVYLTTSWQKIGVLMTPVNVHRSPYELLLEEMVLAWDVQALAPILEHVRTLRTWFGEGEILSSRYTSAHIVKCGVERWEELEAQVSPWRPSHHLEVLAYLARKTKEEKESQACQSLDKKPSQQASLW